MEKKSQVENKRNSKQLAEKDTKDTVERRSQFKILFTGAVIGAIGAILLVPQSEQKTRERLAKQSQWVGRKFGDLGRGISEQAKKVADREAIHNGSGYADTLGGESFSGRMSTVIEGVLAAVSSTLLFAPQSEKETRQWLVKQMRTGRDGFKEAVEKVQSDAQEGTRRVRDRVQEGVQSIGGMAPHMSNNGDPSFAPKGLMSAVTLNMRTAIENYIGVIRYLGEKDTMTRRLMEEVLAKEEEYTEELATLLQRLEPAQAV